MAATLERAATTVSVATSQTDKSWHGTLAPTRCLEGAPAASRVVPGLGFTSCPSPSETGIAWDGCYMAWLYSALIIQQAAWKCEVVGL